MPCPISLNTIQDLTIRQHLQDHTEKLLQRTKLDTMLVYLEIPEVKTNEIRIYMYFDKMMTEMKIIQRSGPKKSLNETMFNLMGQQSKSIDEYLLCHYKLKAHFFDKAPSVMNQIWYTLGSFLLNTNHI